MKRFSIFLLAALLIVGCRNVGDNLNSRFNDASNTQTMQSITATTGTITTGTVTTLTATTATLGTAAIDSSTNARTLASINGGANNAAIGRSTDTDTGLYFLAATGNRLGITAKGAAVAIFDSAGATVTGIASADTLRGTNFKVTGYGIFNGTIIGRAAATITGLFTADSAMVNNLKFKQEPIQLTVSRTALTTESGKLFWARPIAAKETLTLPAAAAGLVYDVFVADADTLAIKAASGDTLVDGTDGAGYVITTTVAGKTRILALDDVRWLFMSETGTWTSY